MKFRYLSLGALVLMLSLAVSERSLWAAAAPDSLPNASKAEIYYEGPWVTTKNKQLNGTMTCQIKQLPSGHWQGRFWGVWQKVPFDYTVDFEADRDVVPLGSWPMCTEKTRMEKSL